MSKNPLNHQNFKLAAPGNGVILYTKNETRLQVILSQRDPSVGEGISIAGGGFVECIKLMEKPVGTISYSQTEAYRELCEENPGLEDIISPYQFNLRAQPIASFVVRTADLNGIHACGYYAIEISFAEQLELLKLPASDERRGDLFMADLSIPNKPGLVTDIDNQLTIRLTPKGNDTEIEQSHFFHQHEYTALRLLAGLSVKNRLWRLADIRRQEGF